MVSRGNFARFLALASVILIAGCGGGGGVSSGYPAAAPSVAPPLGPGIDGGSTMKTLAAGDTWRFAVTGTVTADYFDSAGNKGTHTGAVTAGTMTRAVASVSWNGNPVFQITDTLTYTPQGGLPTTSVTQRYYTQAVDGTLTQVGDRDENLEFATGSPTVAVPGTFSQLGNVADSTTYSSLNVGQGTRSVQTSFTVRGSESIPASTGAPFLGWRVETTRTENGTYDPISQINAGVPVTRGFVIGARRSSSTIDHWAPSLGIPVLSHLTSNETDTVVISYTIGGTQAAPTYTFKYDTLATTANLDFSLIARN